VPSSPYPTPLCPIALTDFEAFEASRTLCVRRPVSESRGVFF
jgi:hypothetical protein